ncbi:MAG: type IV secretion system protein [Burkholderiales bacterium]|jgi:type IV secretion system protein VirB6|nr:type IV secretion system protein [Burkholderiales bacterium]
MAFTAFSDMNTWLKTVFEPLADKLPADLAQGVIPLIALGVSVQVAFHGFAVIRGTGGSNHFLDVFAKAMRAFLVFALCLAGSEYVDHIRPIFKDLQDSLTSYVTHDSASSGGGGGGSLGAGGSLGGGGGGSADINVALDTVMQSGVSVFETVHKLLYDREHLSVEICPFGGCKGTHLDGVPAIILQAILSFFILAFGIFAFIDVQVISQSIVIVLAFGPLFLAGFAFESTAKWAEGWLTSVVKYVLTAIVLLVIVLAAKEQATTFISELSSGASGEALIPVGGTIGAPMYEAQGKLIAIMIVLAALLAKASNIAADMVGSLGVASNAIGMVRAAQGAALGGMKGMVQGGANGGGVRGAMKGLAYGAAGMAVTDGMGRGSRPVSGARGGSGGGGGGGSGAGPSAPKTFARRAKQRAVNTAAYAMGTAAGRTIGQTRLPAMAQQARRGLASAFRSSDPIKAASVQSSKRAGSSFRDAWQRAKSP